MKYPSQFKKIENNQQLAKEAQNAADEKMLTNL